MIGRLFRIFLFFALAAWLLARLLNRKQQRALYEIAVITAWACVAAAALVLSLRLWPD